MRAGLRRVFDLPPAGKRVAARRHLRLGSFVLAAALGAVCARRSRSIAWDRRELAEAGHVSTTVLDRHDRLLRAFTTNGDRWRLPLEPDAVDQRYLAMLLAFEDKRFYAHPGVDIGSLARAAWQLARHRRIISGGSTLTMQVARLLEGRHERTSAGKLRQIAGALQLERHSDQAADPRPLPAACAVRRQHRGRARRLAGLLRQGAAAAVRRRGRPARRAAAVARVAAPRPQPEGRARRPQPRARAHGGGRRDLAGGSQARARRAGAARAPRLPQVRAAPLRGGSEGRAAEVGAPPDASTATCSRRSRRSPPSRRSSWARSCRRPSSSSSTQAAR